MRNCGQVWPAEIEFDVNKDLSKEDLMTACGARFWIGLDWTSLLIRVNRRRYFQNAWPEVIRHYAFYLQELLLKISERFVISPVCV